MIVPIAVQNQHKVLLDFMARILKDSVAAQVYDAANGNGIL